MPQRHQKRFELRRITAFEMLLSIAACYAGSCMRRSHWLRQTAGKQVEKGLVTSSLSNSRRIKHFFLLGCCTTTLEPNGARINIGGLHTRHPLRISMNLLMQRVATCNLQLQQLGSPAFCMGRDYIVNFPNNPWIDNQQL
jgi:hypothetical protein